MATTVVATFLGCLVCLWGVLNSLDPDQHLDIRLSLARIPPTPTYYVCQQFQVPADVPYHAVRFEPRIDNRDAVHHMLVFGCDFEMDTKGPHPCSGLDSRCPTWLVKWDMGMEGDITLPEMAGVRFGQGSFKHLLLQMHWNNPGSLDNLTDSSGMRIHYTSHLRPHSAGNVQIGQQNFSIPANTRQHAETGSCSATCTKLMLPHPIYITRVYMHMHKLGKIASLARVDIDGQLLEGITADTDYEYSRPAVHEFSPGIQVNPGEEIRLTCTFDSHTGSRYRNQTVTAGEGASSEMCYAFLTYYPAVVGFQQCLQLGKEDVNCKIGSRQ